MAEQRDDFIIALRYALLKKGTQQKFSLFFLIIFSIIIITLDKLSFSYIQKTRSVLNDLIYQVAIVTSSPEKFTKYVIKLTYDHYAVYKENEELKEEIEVLRNEKIQNEYLLTENTILKEALQLAGSKSLEQDVSIIAKVIIDQQSPYLKSFLLNKGSKDGVMKGMTVFSKKYLIGTIIESNFLTSRVLLINDLNSRIPVIIENTSVNAILTGLGKDNSLDLQYLPEQYQLATGRNIYTSGKDGVLAAGIPVGETYTDKSQQVKIRSLADLNQTLFVNITNGQLRR
jgi:rod shape-determining protein MreC